MWPFGTVAMSRGCPSRHVRPGRDVSKVPLATVSVPKVPLATCSAGLTCPEGAPRDAGGPLGGPARNHPPTGIKSALIGSFWPRAHITSGFLDPVRVYIGCLFELERRGKRLIW